jgi:membrane protease YdiL (CAAX protease family)
MIGPATAALILAIILVVLPPLIAPLESRFLRSKPGTARKLAYYAFTIVALWVLAAAAARIFGIEGLRDASWPWKAWLPLPAIGGPLMGVLLAAYFLLALMPLIQSLRGPRWRRAYAKAYRRYAEDFAGLLPETGIERFAFILLSLTAGVCEEALYRGFLIRYLHDGAAALPLFLALAAASLAFGLAHIYQGAPALLRTGIAGLAFGLLFLMTGSLIPAVVLHALIDLQGLYVLWPLSDEDMPSESPGHSAPSQSREAHPGDLPMPTRT